MKHDTQSWRKYRQQSRICIRAKEREREREKSYRSVRDTAKAHDKYIEKTMELIIREIFILIHSISTLCWAMLRWGEEWWASSMIFAENSNLKQSLIRCWFVESERWRDRMTEIMISRAILIKKRFHDNNIGFSLVHTFTGQNDTKEKWNEQNNTRATRKFSFLELSSIRKIQLKSDKKNFTHHQLLHIRNSSARFVCECERCACFHFFVQNCISLSLSLSVRSLFRYFFLIASSIHHSCISQTVLKVCSKSLVVSPFGNTIKSQNLVNRFISSPKRDIVHSSR